MTIQARLEVVTVPVFDPNRSDYASFADVIDPDGDSWVLQERDYLPTTTHGTD